MGRVITDATKMKFDCVKELVRVMKINKYHIIDIIYEIIKRKKVISFSELKSLIGPSQSNIYIYKYASVVRALKGIYSIGDYYIYNKHVNVDGKKNKNMSLRVRYTLDEAEDRLIKAQEYGVLTKSLDALNLQEVVWVYNRYVSSRFTIDDIMTIYSQTQTTCESCLTVLIGIGCLEKNGDEYTVIRGIPIDLTFVEIKKLNSERIKKKMKPIKKKQETSTKINGYTYDDVCKYIDSYNLKGEERNILTRAIFASLGISEKCIVFN